MRPSLSSLLHGTWEIAHEALRLLLKRPLASVVAVAVDGEGRVVLMRRRDDGKWSLPGGLMDWGERLEETLRREVREETGYHVISIDRVVGLYSDPARDPRFHSIAIAVACTVALAANAPPQNPMEVIEVRAFPVAQLPEEMAFDGRRILDDHARAAPTKLA